MKDVRHETFCIRYTENGGNATEAYNFTFPAKHVAVRKRLGVSANACNFMKLPHIKARIAELQQSAADQCLWTIQQSAEQFDKAYNLAESLNQPAAMVAAATQKAKLFGLMTEKVDVTHNLRVEDARQIVESMLARHGGKVIEGNFRKTAG